ARCRADELAHSEARYRTLVEDIDLGVTLVDANHNVVMTNGAAERILRRLGSTTGERKCFLGLETSEAACSHCPGTRAMATLRPVEMETEGVRDDGTPFTVRIRALPVCEPDGEATGFIEVVEDITERKRIESQARERQAELAHVARLGTIGEMAAGLAHEINQPLASIVNYLEATLEGLQRGSSDAAAMREDIRQAAEQAVRAGEIIQRLRSFVGQPRPKRTNVDMNELVGEVVELTMSDVRNLGVATHLELASSLPSVDVDAIQIQQVLVNLIRNGIEAMAGAGTGQLIIRTSAQDEEAVELSVVDSGPGLRGNAADRVFEAFYSTKTDGMGLGLSISRRIIEAHGGRLWATSTNGGATFRFTLPTNHLGVNE
ncbi:MAG: ATP-binding protein, partial [Phycisphaerae bacterium]